MSPDMIKAIGDAISSVAWPLIVLYLIISQRGAVSSILSNLDSFTLPGGVEAKLRKRVEKESEAVLEEKFNDKIEVSERQLIAAESVRRASLEGDISAVRNQIYDISREYERVRSSMSSGDARTRRMEIVMTKMRTLGLAAFPLLDELKESTSPGARLAAIAVLQVTPNIEYVEWLAERLKVEQPFVGYHAAVALDVAARVVNTDQHPRFLSAISEAKKYLGESRRNSDRWHMLDRAERQVLDQ
ncbi:hypothetical protein [Thiosocius teredinicola]|uniref:hypothetical protein n=1 Tax=Thiosocius teredinicola TaxID=1973002 RepID=UPI000F7B3BAF